MLKLVFPALYPTPIRNPETTLRMLLASPAPLEFGKPTEEDVSSEASHQF